MNELLSCPTTMIRDSHLSENENEHTDKLLLRLATEFRRPFTGWDYSYLKGRVEEKQAELPWNYENTVRELLTSCTGLLEIGTGGGEFLASLSPLPENTCATENRAPNIDTARQRLKPLGVTVTAVTDYDVRLPLNDCRFDLIINRHEHYISHEVYRLLKTDGMFVTQQVGENDNMELNQLLNAPEYLGRREWNLEHACNELENIGFDILAKEEAFIETKFYDVGAIVYYLKVAPWQIEDFSIEKYSEQLINLHHLIQKEGYISVRSHRFFIVAKR
ncbi:sam-dependent methyltransferase [Gigaspora margarita]|uniref:Sam-dependent methyltransferase n=1 Tax=Gigaspora margarita TaxID=4874 RepID=A0A8H3WYU0_GIGMA|nr:sam-dependent methyltransferase [Gigaspora margarita]